MSDAIVQTFGIDASNALDGLAKLDVAFQKFEDRIATVAQKLDFFNKSSGKVNGAMKNVASGAREAASGLKQVGDASSGLEEADKKTRSLAISWETLTRVVVTQAIVRSLNALRNAFAEGITEAIEFQRQIALIGTIDSSGAGFSKTAEAVRELSDEFNIGLGDAAEGVYQAISNQVGDFATSLEFTAEAARFATATNSTLTDSVDLLSGAMKSYNLSADDADKISSIFFTTIDKGRITADQLSNSFGRVGPVAADLGVSLEEVNAAIAAISVRGSNTNEALTQFRSIMSGLLKPSDAMKEALTQIGFESGEAAINTLGLAGTIEALQKTTGGSSEQLARLFPNVRALSGVSSLLGDDFTQFTEALKAMTEQTREFNKQKFGQVAATDANRLTKEINKLKNAFTVDLGQSILEAGVSFSDFIGGADNVITVVKALGPVLLGGGAALVAYAGYAKFASTELGKATVAVNGLNAALLGLAAAPLAAGLGTAIGKQIDSALRNAAFADLDALEENHAKALKTLQDTLNKERDMVDKSVEERVKAANKLLAELNQVYRAEIAPAQIANDVLVSNAKSALDEVLDSRKRLVDELGKAAADTATIAEEAADRIRDLEQEQSDRQFEQRIGGFGDVRQASEILKRSQEIADQAAAEFQSGTALGDPEKIKEAIKQFERAEKLQERALQIGKGENNRAIEFQAIKGLNELTNRRIQLEKQLGDAQDERRKKILAEQKRQQGANSEFEGATKQFKSNLGVLDENGRPFTKEELARRKEERGIASQTLSRLGLSPEDLEQLGSLGASTFIRRFEQNLTADPIQLRFEVDAEADRIKGFLDKAFENYRAKNPFIDAVEGSLGRETNSPAEFEAGLRATQEADAAARRRQDEARKAQQAIDQSRTELVRAQQEVQNQLAATQSRLSGGAGLSVDAFLPAPDPENISKISDLQSRVTALGQSNNIAAQQVADLKAEIISLGQSVTDSSFFNSGNRLAFSNPAELLLAQVQDLERIQQSQQSAGNFDAASAEVKRYGDVWQQVGSSLQQQQGILSQTPSALQQEKSALDADTSSLNANTEARRRNAAAAAAQQTAAPSAGAVPRMFGGPMSYFANGGYARGTDNIPAMLTRGESVINRASSQRFFSQIQAMNAGITPVFRESGGSVTNYNVGDINLTNQSTGNAQVDGKKLVSAFNRELRKRTSRLS